MKHLVRILLPLLALFAMTAIQAATLPGQSDTQGSGGLTSGGGQSGEQQDQTDPPAPWKQVCEDEANENGWQGHKRATFLENCLKQGEQDQEVLSGDGG